MTRSEAIPWLQAILDDTLDPNDASDAKRREAVELAIEVLSQDELRAVVSAGALRRQQ